MKTLQLWARINMHLKVMAEILKKYRIFFILDLFTLHVFNFKNLVYLYKEPFSKFLSKVITTQEFKIVLTQIL